MTQQDIITKLFEAIKEFTSDHAELLKQDAHEEALNTHFLKYIEKYFAALELDVDSQYDRRFVEDVLVKKTANFIISQLPKKYIPKDLDPENLVTTKEIYPDLIVHDRKSSLRNFLAVEIKKSTNTNKAARAFDELKLRIMTGPELSYSYGVLITFKTGVHFEPDHLNAEVIFFSNGQDISIL